LVVVIDKFSYDVTRKEKKAIHRKLLKSETQGAIVSSDSDQSLSTSSLYFSMSVSQVGGE
jgi:hypothetical protein